MTKTAKAPTTKVSNGIENGLAVDLQTGVTVCARMNFDYEVGIEYSVTFHNGELPAFEVETFDTVQDLANAMRDYADLRTWCLIEHS